MQIVNQVLNSNGAVIAELTYDSGVTGFAITYLYADWYKQTDLRSISQALEEAAKYLDSNGV